MTLALIASLSSCGGGPVDPGSTGGELLPGTEGAAYLGGRPFSLSPGGRWLLFSSADDGAMGAGDLPTIMTRMLEGYVLYDLDRRRGRSIAIGSDVERFIAGGAQILADGGCWVPEGEGWQVVLRDSFNRFLRLDPRTPEPTWEVAELDRAVAVRRCPLPRHVPPDRNRTVGPFQARGSGTRRVVVTGGEGARTYAIHRKRLPFGSLLLGDVALATDQRRFAYTVTPALGSFIGNPRAFVVDQRQAGQAPRPLAAPVDAMAWSTEGKGLFAYVSRRNDAAIYVWAF